MHLVPPLSELIPFLLFDTGGKIVSVKKRKGASRLGFASRVACLEGLQSDVREKCPSPPIAPRLQEDILSMKHGFET